MFHRSLAAIALISVAMTATYLWAQPRDQHKAKTQIEYRVMSLWEMFEGDAESERKVKQMFVTVKTSGHTGTQRTDMDVQDYQKALNAIAKDGWELVTVNKSNYWVFKRVR